MKLKVVLEPSDEGGYTIDVPCLPGCISEGDTKVPILGYERVIRALQRDGWVVVHQKGSHIRFQKNLQDEVLKLTAPAHRPIKKFTLSHI